MTAIDNQVRLIESDRRASRRVAIKLIERQFAGAISHAYAAARLNLSPVEHIGNAIASGGNFQRAIGRVMFVSYLDGIRRMLRDAEKANGKRLIGKEPITLARDKKDDDELLAWLLLLLGISKDTGERIESGFVAQAEPIVRRMAGPVIRRIESLPAELGLAERRAGVSEAFKKSGLSKYESWAFRGWSEIVVNRPFEAGRFDAVEMIPAVSEMVWGYHYYAKLDGRETKMCHDLDGWIARADDPYMKALRPPNHWRCRSAQVPVWQSSKLKIPEPHRTVSDAELNLYVAKKEQFLRYAA